MDASVVLGAAQRLLEAGIDSEYGHLRRRLAALWETSRQHYLSRPDLAGAGYLSNLALWSEVLPFLQSCPCGLCRLRTPVLKGVLDLLERGQSVDPVGIHSENFALRTRV